MSTGRPGGLRRLLRHFPFTGFQVVFLPLFAHLVVSGRLTRGLAVAQVVPFVLATTAGYIYNNLTDLRDPPHKPNPVADGTLVPAVARRLLGAVLAAAVASFALLYRRPEAWLAFGAYLGLTLAYSGLGVRFKETWLGPFLGAAVLWVGGPAILAIETRATSGPVGWMLASACLTFSARELCHTLTDLADDRASGYRTFAVRAGADVTRRLEIGLLAAGLAAWSWSAGAMLPASAPALQRAVVPALGCAALLVAALARRPGRAATVALDAPYPIVKLAWISGALLILDLDPATTGLLLWLFLTSKIG